MIRRPLHSEDPDRLYIVTGGRSRADESRLDLVTLIVSECEPAPGMQSEHVRILEMCRRPTAVVEVSANLGMPVSVVKILLGDLLDTGKVTARHPQHTGTGRPGAARLPRPEILKEVLLGLQRL
ncbi:DUF742 domain-containing protein [Streptomyces sp. NPDC059506]|uniref:DUF742 domain-containing protein n=1 Tax=Streptomyces thermolineatus TaxID=44033 RepID=A0ABN3KU63_9ACTN|nr:MULTISPECIES: DUF742 domain-containing protein [unclassified Streptomyces]MCZ2527969.1 DUF742 domain-containing protein [Streptomyces sp. HB2AG]PLW64458.1 DUF742 domain-containing protein [Streptomyces sp. DJ]QMV21800.1 DUF742 domain-containing protein [Streptomyces sp. SCUT-3]